MSKKTTIYDIAEKLNITAATVSRALNGNPKISEATRQLVSDTAKEMNYEQNKLALALKSGKSYNVGVIVPRIDSNFFEYKSPCYRHRYVKIIEILNFFTKLTFFLQSMDHYINCIG